jgi:enoyl-[acyl-carrier protein] reductase II
VYPRFSSLSERGAAFLGVKHPIICGAMTWVSDAELVAATSHCGGFGLLAAGNLEPDALLAEIERTRALTDTPFGVNLITIAPSFQAHLDVACEMHVPYVVFAAVFPDAKSVEKAKDAGCKTLCFASTDAVATRMIRMGIDALLLEGSEAGGHIGPVSSLVLMQEVLLRWRDEIPIFMAGGIATGQAIAHVMLMGAAGVQMGTRFIMSDECRAHPDFKEAFRTAHARDAMATPSFDSRLPVIPVRALRNEGSKQFAALQLELIQQLDRGEIDRNKAQELIERFWIGALRRAVEEGDVAHGSLMAGQSVGLAGAVKPMHAVFEELLGDAETELERVAAQLAT